MGVICRVPVVGCSMGVEDATQSHCILGLLEVTELMEYRLG